MFGRQERQTSHEYSSFTDPYETISILQSRNMLLLIEGGDIWPDQKKHRLIVSLDLPINAPNLEIEAKWGTCKRILPW